MLLATTLTLSIVETILLFLGALTLGITIHFFITSRKSLKSATAEAEATRAKNDWKRKYLNDLEILDKELANAKHQLQVSAQQLREAEENANIYSIEAEEMRILNKKLENEIEQLRQQEPVVIQQPAPVAAPIETKGDYIHQLLVAQNSLLQHNQTITELLGNIEVLKQSEEKQREIRKANEELMARIEEMQFELANKDREIAAMRQKQELTKEVGAMLDSAYNEFNVLQDKIQKMESQLASSKVTSLQFDDLKEEHTRLRRDYEEQSQKLTLVQSENKRIEEDLMLTEDKLREANFQRQQLQKRVAYLEELNKDLQVMSEANKKLEGRLKRIGELESMLNIVSEEKNELLKREQA